VSAATRRPAWVAAVVALVGLGAIGVAQGFPNREAIEENLTQRSSAALEQAGVSGVQVSFVGRDGTLLVPTQAEVDRAQKIVAAVEGVRVVEAHAVASPSRTPSVTIRVDSALVTMEGSVPSAAAKNALNTVGNAEKLTVDSGVSDAGLAGLPAVVRALGGRAVDVSIMLRDGEIILTGTVESAAVRDAAVAAAGQAVGSGKVADRLQVKAAEGVQLALAQLSKITFENDSVTLTADGQATVLKAVEILRAHPNAKVRIEGHTDSNGTPESNLVLSQARAQAVLDALVAQGIGAERLTAIGFGETRLQAPGSSLEDHAINRRVEFVAS
jgi:outer membrane protein OmpA-like peptidoglycan-associated protein